MSLGDRPPSSAAHSKRGIETKHASEADSDLALPFEKLEVARTSLPDELWDNVLESLHPDDLADREDLVNCLRVSKTFFAGSTAQLCRVIDLPAFQFGHQSRDVQNAGTLNIIPAIADPFRTASPPSQTMVQMYSKARLGVITDHGNCTSIHPLHVIPNIKTVVASAQQSCMVQIGNRSTYAAGTSRFIGLGRPARPVMHQDCNPFYACPVPIETGLTYAHDTCPLLRLAKPKRLVVHAPCHTYFCMDHNGIRPLLAPCVETLVLALQCGKIYTAKGPQCVHRPHGCYPFLLPFTFRPKKLVFSFDPVFRMTSMQQQRHDPFMIDRNMSLIRQPEHEPRPCLNFFYWMALACIQVSRNRNDGCDIIIVGGDQLAQQLTGMERYDPEIPALERDPDESYGGLYLTEEARSHPTAFAMYDLAGNVVNGPTQMPIPVANIRAAADMVSRRVEVIKQTLFAWIDNCIDPVDKPDMSIDDRVRSLPPITGRCGYRRSTNQDLAHMQKPEDDKADKEHLAHAKKICTGGLGGKLSEAKREALKESIKGRVRRLTLREYHLEAGDLDVYHPYAHRIL